MEEQPIKGINMAIATETRTTLKKNLIDYEDSINHLYLDTKGKVTVGIGHLIANKNAMSGVSLYKVKNKLLTQPATLLEKMTEYANIAKLPWGKRYGAKSFEKHTTLRMKEFDINTLLNKHIDNFYRELKNIYKKDKGYSKNFDDFDSKVQLALFDMIFNLGATKLVNSFPKFNEAIKSGDFEKAAIQSHRLDVHEARNKHVQKLFEDASTGVIVGVPIGQINQAEAQV